ncbi:MAG: HAMP domain-containing sensor histidine kinase [Candidatus Metalachnospira sp.]|nr:HAMP domain-containing sensor histidine kinase [Candidatus Metalachnospira sp.]
MMNRIKSWFDKIPITRKVTILYSFVVMFAIMGISAVLLYSARDMGAGVVFTTLKDWSTDVEDYVKSGKEVSEEAFDEMLSDSYVDYIIENKTTGDVYLSTNMNKDIKEGTMNSPSPSKSNSSLADHSGMTPLNMNNDSVSDNADSEKQNESDQTDVEKSGSADITDNADKEEMHDDSAKRGFPFFGNQGYTIYNKNGRDFISVDNEFMYNGNLYSTRLLKRSTDNMLFVKYIEARLFYINLLGILFAVLIGMYISKVLLRPVKKIRETAERISVEDLSQRIKIEGPDDEMKELSITFNSMIDRLERSFEQQSRFVSDASHELRTPIAVIKGYANLINRWGKGDPVILQEAVTNILEETDHMSVMIKNLLFLARSDQKRSHVQMCPMSINDAVKDIAKDLGVTEDRVNIVTEICDEVLVTNGDPDLIKQMLWIFTENAVKYSGEEKTITYKLYKEDKYACISVADNGCGISEDDLPHIFERFYRVDKSRNKEIPGNGLGLSIAKWIMDVHEGKIEIKSVVGQGTEFISKFKLS